MKPFRDSHSRNGGGGIGFAPAPASGSHTSSPSQNPLDGVGLSELANMTPAQAEELWNSIPGSSRGSSYQQQLQLR